jgi:hypothetical protein
VAGGCSWPLGIYTRKKEISQRFYPPHSIFCGTGKVSKVSGILREHIYRINKEGKDQGEAV